MSVRYTNRGDTSIWPGKWRELHCYTINYAVKPTFIQKRIAKRWLSSFFNSLPCPSCKSHAIKYMKENPPNLNSREDFQIWGWMFHNRVNLRLRKPTIRYEDGFKVLYNINNSG